VIHWNDIGRLSLVYDTGKTQAGNPVRFGACIYLIIASCFVMSDSSSVSLRFGIGGAVVPFAGVTITSTSDNTLLKCNIILVLTFPD